MTIDQRGSRAGADLVDELLDHLNAGQTAGPDGGGVIGRVRDFERTAGDEVQGVLNDPAAVLSTALDLAHAGQWSVGIGVGEVRRPLPASTRAGAGPAFEFAREAVTDAKHASGRVAVRGADPRCDDVEAVIQLLAALALKRSDAAVEAGALLDAGMTQEHAAARLQISQQAVSRRLRAGLWREDRRVRDYARRLLGKVDTCP